MSDKAIGPVPVIIELERPCKRWSVEYDDGTPKQFVSVTRTLRQDIFACGCGCKYSWSAGPNYDEPCRHILIVCMYLLQVTSGTALEEIGNV
jgi:hypothetical protein